MIRRSPTVTTAPNVTTAHTNTTAGAIPHAAELSVDNVTIQRGRTTVLEGVSLHVEPGKCLALVGPNGSGKSTLLRAITGITTPLAGSVRVAGHCISDGTLRPRQRAHLLSFVSQEESPAAELTVTEAVALGRTPHRKPWDSHDRHERSAVAAALEAVGLTDLAHYSCAALSGGQRHRVVLARALAQRTPVIVLDEPTNHLDPVWRLRLMDTLRQSRRTVVFSVHELDLALQYADYVAVLHAGHLAACGPPREVLQPDVVREVFHVCSAIVARPRLSATAATARFPHQTPPEHILLWAETESATDAHR